MGVLAGVGRTASRPGPRLDGATRVLVRKSYTGLDGRPEVLEERVIVTFPATDPEWEVRFIEGMGQARFRCTYLNAEE